MRPDVSVVIPTYNRRSMVQEAIESCFTGNDEIDVEVVVVDDGSTDGARKYLERINDESVRSIFQEHQGAQVARNTGQKAARGKAIKHLDDDDYLLPGQLVNEYKTLRKTKVDVCYADFRKVNTIDDESSPYVNAHHTEVDSDFYTALVSGKVNRLQLAILFDRSAVEGIKWDESLKYLQDVDFMLRAATRGLSCAKLNRTVAVHRIHENERISDVRQAARTPRRLKRKAEWYYRAYEKLKERGEVTDSRLEATARRLWHIGHMLVPYEWRAGHRWLRRAVEVDESIVPDRSNRVLAQMDQMLSPLLTEKLMSPIRTLRLRVRNKIR